MRLRTAGGAYVVSGMPSVSAITTSADQESPRATYSLYFGAVGGFAGLEAELTGAAAAEVRERLSGRIAAMAATRTVRTGLRTVGLR